MLKCEMVAKHTPHSLGQNAQTLSELLELKISMPDRPQFVRILAIHAHPDNLESNMPTRWHG